MKAIFKKILRRLRQRPAAIYDIGKKSIPKNAKRALIIYSLDVIPHFVRGKLMEFPNMTHHSRYWESAEIARLLVNRGYLVDYFHSKGYPPIQWDRYDVVIDCLNNLKDAPDIPDQKKIYYATSNHWLEWNLAELYRTKMFRERTGISVPTNRQLPTIASDEYADYLTHFGTNRQIATFSKKPKTIQLNISSVAVPAPKEKNIAAARNKFLWLGGGGMLCKGMDLVLEAFAKMPRFQLYVAGDLEDQPEFWGWAKELLAKYDNIHYLGFMDVATPKFAAMANDCIGIVYASAAEGGPGSVAQALHFGLIPIVTPSSYVRAEVLGYSIDGITDREITDSIIEQVSNVSQLPKAMLREKSELAREFALRYHTRAAYTESFEKLLDELQH